MKNLSIFHFCSCSRGEERADSDICNKKAPQHPLTVQNPIPMPRKNQTPAETPEEELARLRRENAQLQEALKMAEWTCHAKDVMIDLAEKTFNIPIRKKSGAKQ